MYAFTNTTPIMPNDNDNNNDTFYPTRRGTLIPGPFSKKKRNDHPVGENSVWKDRAMTWKIGTSRRETETCKRMTKFPLFPCARTKWLECTGPQGPGRRRLGCSSSSSSSCCCCCSTTKWQLVPQECLFIVCHFASGSSEQIVATLGHVLIFIHGSSSSRRRRLCVIMMFQVIIPLVPLTRASRYR